MYMDFHNTHCIESRFVIGLSNILSAVRTCPVFSPGISHFGALKGLIYQCTVAYTTGKQDRPHRLLGAQFTRLQPPIKQIITK